MAISCSTDPLVRRAFEVIGRPDLSLDARFQTHDARMQHVDELDALMQEWIGQHELDEVIAQFSAAGAAVSPIGTIKEILEDEHFKARQLITTVDSESAVWFDQGAKLTYRGLSLTQNPQANMPPSTFFSGQYFNSAKNWEGFTSEAYAQATGAIISEPDLARQKQLGAQINDILLDECFVMPITLAPPYVVARSNVQGLRYEVHEDISFTSAWIA